ncbi:NAD(P)H-dependent oxidoreductase subunit E [Corynebacterium uterequi]|uniref:NADH:ubiquinone oxidoreductase 24 kD subunit n=1 Tax=Corynebacterium uterequi TaxID=1072256 RepID=A0A0G3HBJ3_9CORY|nr:NAD(P)H-dependent oxidoreductase subunit E [Corynebacterium uterequi]AKK10624.1 NADH:ubiquinone oxidoreductase 24 kD subunit [Corynebacterium uterequi]
MIDHQLPEGVEQHFHAHFDDEPVDMNDTATNIDDATVAELEELAGRYPNKQSAMIPMLHLVQSVDGHVTGEGVRHIARILEVTEAQVLGVVTFYTMFYRRKVGKHLVGVCTTSLCATMGGDLIYDAVKKHAAGKEDLFTVERVECNAACDFAPVMMLNWEFMDNMTPRKAVDILDRLEAGREVRSTRGPEITSWRDNERVLAGFYDGKADEGPAAGQASLAGLDVLRESTATEHEGRR